MVVLQLQPSNGVNFRHPKPFPFPLGRRLRASTIPCLKMQAFPFRTQRIMESISVSGEVGGAGGAYSYGALKRLDELWSSVCSAQTVVQEPQKVVSTMPGSSGDSDIAEKALDRFDVVVFGGTLGIFIATALCSKGLRVAIVERHILKGREQEWYISRKELLDLVKSRNFRRRRY